MAQEDWVEGGLRQFAYFAILWLIDVVVFKVAIFVWVVYMIFKLFGVTITIYI